MHFTAPIVAVLAALGATAEAARATCNRSQYADVAHQIQNPAYFCKFYLKQSRNTSPLKKYGSRSLTQLCKCFVQNSPRVAGPFKPLRPKPAPKNCDINLYRGLKNQYADPVSFCRFYTAQRRDLSPLPAFQNPATVFKACSCYVNKQFAPQRTTTTEDQPEPTEAPTESSSSEAVPTTTTTTTSSDLAGAIGGTRATTSTTSLPTILPIGETTSTTFATSTSAATSDSTTSAATTSAATTSEATSSDSTSAATSAATSASG